MSDKDCAVCKYSDTLESHEPCVSCHSDSNMFEEVEGFDEVKKALHYNVHPSGVECADISQYFDNCRGQALQYIWRCEDKGTPIKDLKKAIYWLERKIKLYEKEGHEE